MIRPELRATLCRWREVIAAAMVLAAGAWLALLGGWLLVPIGFSVAVLALGWGIVALRRVRFLQGVTAPGVVEVDEGQVGYLGPNFGGFVALADLSELRLTAHRGARQWRLSTLDGEALTIPVDANGAEKLFDAFAALPGIDMAAVTAALDHRQPALPLWRRPPQKLRRD